MTLKECYRILNLPRSADLDEIKKAYRRLAFELHPDLNPDPDAGRRFQEVNEAYVLLTRTLQAESRRDPRVQHRKPPQSADRPEGQARRAQTQTQAQSHTQGHTQAQNQNHTQAHAQTQTQARPGPAQAARSGAGAQAQAGQKPPTGLKDSIFGGGFWKRKTQPKGSPHNYTGSVGPAAAKPRPENGRSGPFAQGAARSGHYGPADPETGAAGRPGGPIFSGPDPAANTAHAGQVPPTDDAHAKQEEVLGEILNDPFARRVFEDIYSQVKGERATRDLRPPKERQPPKKKKLSLEWGKRKVSFDLSDGISGAVKAWLRRQLDQEQLLELPGQSIVPGARIRLRVGGLFGDTQQVEVRLPPEYQPGAPIRLKGLGRRLGPWRGDLYLRVVPKAGQED